MKPWIATVRYKSKIGEMDDDPVAGMTIEYELDDPGQLALIIRQGPGWGALLWTHLRRSDSDLFPAINYEDLETHQNVSVSDIDD